MYNTNQLSLNKKHFACTIPERKKYILEKFEIGKNDLLNPDEKSKLVDIFVKHWAALDITDKRVPTLKPDIIPKHKIETFGILKKAKVRPLNPEMSKKVKEILLDWEK